MKKEQKDIYILYRSNVEKILSIVKNEINDHKLISDATLYFDNGEHGLALDALIYTITNQFLSVSFELYHEIEKCLLEFGPDGDYLRHETVDMFYRKLKSSKIVLSEK